MSFAVPFSSSPPSTPGARTLDLQKRQSFTSMANHPSTTPAGPPPSSAPSFTPAGPPPSSVFGSSQLGTGVSKLQFQPQSDRSRYGSSSGGSAMKPPSRTKNGTPAQPFGANVFKPPPSIQSSPAPQFGQSGYSTVYEEEEDGNETDEDEDLMNVRRGHEGGSTAGTPAFKGFTAVNTGKRSFQGQPSSYGRSTQNRMQRSKLEESKRRTQSLHKPSALPGKARDSVIPGIARELAARSKDARLFESDGMILVTEDIIDRTSEEVEQRGLLPEVTQGILSTASTECLRLWSNSSESYEAEGLVGGLGPGDLASPISKATFLASLLLSLHCPPLEQVRHNQGPWNTNARSMAIVPFSTPRAAPLPKVLLEWLDKYHISVDGALQAVQNAQPNCTAHEFFWDTVLGLLIRGKFTEIIRLFREADFKHATSSVDDGEHQPGYRGAQLQSVQNVVGRARQVLESSPAIRQGDWNVGSADWSLYRKRVESELDYLADAAEGANREEDDPDDDAFQAENFGIRNMSHTLSQSTRRAQSNVPWTIYQNLKVFYNILLGSSAEIIANSQDWLEASLALTIWWDGIEDDNITIWSLNVSRESARSTKALKTEDPYLSRLSASFLAVTNSDVQGTFQINSMSLLEVGLASVLQGNIEGVLGSLKSWSLVVASALTEIGTLGGWIVTTDKARPADLNEDDLMVLSYGQEAQGTTKDDILLRYAEELFNREEIQYGGVVKEGWELAITVATRLDDQALAKDTISHLLDELHLVSQDRMDKLVMLCTDLGLEAEARKVSDRFAEHLMSTTTLYGPAMICYARAHSVTKLRSVVSLLVSYSLVSSVAYPSESQLDPSLSALLHNPKSTFSNIAEIDPEAASLLQFQLSGYASLRRYYTLRDADFLPKTDRTSVLRPLARTRVAAKYLIAGINSAADSIYGGLYDSQRESALQVDGLLPLLGEASALLSQHQQDGKHVFTRQQIYDLLAAIEDVQTVNERVYGASQECFDATIRYFHGGENASPPDPIGMLKKSVSSGSGSNFSFSMMGSEMLNSGSSAGLRREPSGNKSVGGSGVLVPGSREKVERGWDWRSKYDRDVKSQDVLATLRTGLAAELGWANLRGNA